MIEHNQPRFHEFLYEIEGGGVAEAAVHETWTKRDQNTSNNDISSDYIVSLTDRFEQSETSAISDSNTTVDKCRTCEHT